MIKLVNDHNRNTLIIRDIIDYGCRFCNESADKEISIETANLKCEPVDLVIEICSSCAAIIRQALKKKARQPK